ncbi:MAG TPA: phosphatase PAP2 family protein [Candidatus Limnocylindria bacterium]
MRRLPDPMSRLVVHDDAEHRLGSAVPSPAAAFLIAMIMLPALFWLVMLKRTTVSTAPEEWLMGTIVPAVHSWVETNVPPLEMVIVAISALGSGWFVALAFALLGLLALSRGRRDLALLLALGTLAFPMEWALKYFVSPEAISLQTLVNSLFDVNGQGLDDIADFPAGHALRATVLYGLVAFCIARLADDRRQAYLAYLVAAIVIGAISATRIYLGAHYPIDVLGGWMAGGSLLAILVAIHVLRVDEAARVGTRPQRGRGGRRRVAVPLHDRAGVAAPISTPAEPGGEG